MLSVAVRAAAFLSAAERQRATRFMRQSDSWRFQASRIFLRTVLAHYTQTCPSQLNLTIEEGGKPVLCSSAVDDLSFSLSHCGSSVAVAVGCGVMLGVDIEGPPRVGLVETLARRYFAPREFCDIASLQGEDQIRQFLAYWTLKEAYGKAIGTGLSAGLRAQFDLSDPKGRIYKINPHGAPDPAWGFAQYEVGHQLCMSAAWKGGITLAKLSLFHVSVKISGQARRCLSAGDVTFATIPVNVPRFTD
ncbi:4'-phosphopantetheinyl transferase family protein [Sphingobium subterraneum]|nr:4'-phosphopantetheinyl transferase superfamily protein [Sphingobium subterraneum]